MNNKTSDISLTASTFLILVALIAVIGGAALVQNVYSVQNPQSESTLANHPSETSSQIMTSTTGSAESSGEFVITIQAGSGSNTTSIYYSPPTTTIMLGINNTVTWVNKDTAPHTVTSDTLAFNSGNMNPGASWAFTFTAPGTYDYHCSYHSWMHGTVIVKSG